MSDSVVGPAGPPDWRPSAQQADIERVGLSDRVRQGLLRLAFEVDAEENVAAVLNGESLRSPSYFLLYFDVRERLEIGDVEGARFLLGEPLRRASAEAALKMDPTGTTVGFQFEGIERAVERAVELIPAHARTSDLPIELLADAPDLNSRIMAGLQVLDELWPEAGEEVSSVTAVINGFESEKVIGFTDIHSHGAVFLRRDDIEKAPGVLAEEILHESSHVRFNQMLATHTLFMNGMDAHYSTPLRPDPRHMFGLLHQVFVLRRLTEYLRRAVDAGMREPADLVTACEKLEDGMQVVSDNALFTERGRQLFSALESAAA